MLTFLKFMLYSEVLTAWISFQHGSDTSVIPSLHYDYIHFKEISRHFFRHKSLRPGCELIWAPGSQSANLRAAKVPTSSPIKTIIR